MQDYGLEMPDNISKEKRSWNMSRIHSSDTSIEIKLRKYLFSLGFRYRKNCKSLRGKPDIVLKKYNTVIFINGCFWHRHKNCRYNTVPKTNTEYWVKKFDRNIKNDKKNIKILKKAGWKVAVVWQCQIEKNFKKTAKKIVNFIIK